MPNPFSIQPANFSKGFNGLADIIGEIKEKKDIEAKKQAEIDKEKKITERAIYLLKNGTEEEVKDFMAEYPQRAEGLKKALDFRMPKPEKFREAQFMAAVDPSKIPDFYNEVVSQANEDGVVTPEEQKGIDEFKKLMDTDMEGAAQWVKNGFAASADDDRWKRYQDITKGTTDKPTSAIQEYNFAKKQGYKGSFMDYKKAYGKTNTIEGKTYSKKNQDGSTRTIKNVIPGSEQEKQLMNQEFVEGSQTVGVKPSAEERKQERLNKSVDKLTDMANTDPEAFYKGYNFKQNEDGSLFIDPIEGGPIRLKPFTSVLGKRGNMKAIMALGEQWDDAKELTDLLDLPSVQENLKKAETAGLWDQTKSKFTSTINKWAQDHGIKGDSPTATAIARIQRMASEERKLYMGTAVTDNEMRSALAWMPNAGDSFDSVMNKTRLMGDEAEQAFRRWVSLGESEGADMSPFMTAFKIKRFEQKKEQPKQTADDYLKSIGVE